MDEALLSLIPAKEPAIMTVRVGLLGATVELVHESGVDFHVEARQLLHEKQMREARLQEIERRILALEARNTEDHSNAR